MKKKFIWKFFSFFGGVVDTPDKHSFANISANSKWSQWDTQGPRGHWFTKKNPQVENIMSAPFKNILTPWALKSIYYSLIHCHLIYALPIWSICNQQMQTELFKKQKSSIRAIAGVKYNDHTESHFKNWKSLHFLLWLTFFQYSSCITLCNVFTCIFW